MRIPCLLLVVVATLAGLVGCTLPPAATPRAPTPGAAHFKLMTYNVHREKSGDAGTVDAIGGPDADVVFLQEVTGAWVETLRKRYAKQYPYMLFAPKENAGGLAVLSHYPLEDEGVVPVPGDLHPGWVVHVVLPTARVQVVHVHLRSLFNGTRDVLSNYFTSSGDHVKEMRLFLDRASPELPTIVCGDFNEGPDGEAVELLEDRGFTNMLPMFKPGHETWSGAMGLEMTIDHVMIDRSFAALDGWAERRGNSDHLPVVAHVELRD